MAMFSDLRQLIKPYYWINMLLGISYVTCKRSPVICEYLFPEAEHGLDTRETEILFFLMIVVMIRTRKTGSVTLVNYMSSSFIYTKIANLILWLYADIRYGLPYGVLVIFVALLLPEPTYQGPEYVTYFRGPQTLEDELKHRKNVTWLVCLYAAWHPTCVSFAQIFAEMSASYSLDNLKFGKLDVGRYPEAAAKYKIQDGPTSRQLPTVLLFSEGQETIRRPNADHSGRLIKFQFSKENMKSAFDLDGLYQECKNKSAAIKSGKKTQ